MLKNNYGFRKDVSISDLWLWLINFLSKKKKKQTKQNSKASKVMQLWVNIQKLQLFDRGKVLEAELKRGPIPSKQQVPA